METNIVQETITMEAPPRQVEDSMKSKILEQIKAHMAQESIDTGTGHPIPPIYLKAPDDWP